MGKTISEKILARASNRKTVFPGEVVYAKPDLVVTVDAYAWDWNRLLNELGVSELGIDREKVLAVMDHAVPAGSIADAERHRLFREFVRRHRIEHFYDVGEGGVMHQLMAEKGYALPGVLILQDEVGGTSTVGALGCYAPMGPLTEELASVLATGEAWLEVPETLNVDVSGSFLKCVTSRDLYIKILGDMQNAGSWANRKVLEFSGSCIERLSVDGRMTLCNIAPRAMAEAAIINPDEITLNYVKGRARGVFQTVRSDIDAEYADHLHYDVSQLEPQISLPPSYGNVKTVAEAEGVEIEQAFIGSCANGRLEDLRMAASILRNRHAHKGVRLIITPITQDIYLDALKEGLLEVFIEAGAVVTMPQCGTCFAHNIGVLASGERCIATSPFNFPGRMGSDQASIYLASPLTVAASAVEGKITDPRRFC